MDLPENPTPGQLADLEKYILRQKIASNYGLYGNQNYYQDKQELLGTKLIIFRHKQRKNGGWYVRFYIGNRKYKTLTLGTTDKDVAVERAFEKWRFLQNHIDAGGEIFSSTIQQDLDAYLCHLENLLQTQQLKKHTVQAKRTSLKKLSLYLDSFNKLTEVPPRIFEDYTFWRRTKNWDKSKHKNNPKPPTDQTINKELVDFKGFFDWAKKKKKYQHDIDYPFIKIDWKKSVEKNPSFELEDWMSIVMYLRTWVLKQTNSKGEQRKNLFYRKVFSEYLKVLANSGLRGHEALLLRWSDIQIKKKTEIGKSGKERDRFIVHIQTSPDTKTGRRLVICPAGIYFKRIRELYKSNQGHSPKSSDFIFRNIGTVHSRADHFVGKPLSDTFFRKLWYELLEDLKIDKGIEFEHHYTLYSCRAFFINQRLEMGVPPAIVAELVGHSIKTMERFYKNIRLRQLEPSLVTIRRKQLEEAEFQTFDLD